MWALCFSFCSLPISSPKTRVFLSHSPTVCFFCPLKKKGEENQTDYFLRLEISNNGLVPAVWQALSWVIYIICIMAPHSTHCLCVVLNYIHVTLHLKKKPWKERTEMAYLTRHYTPQVSLINSSSIF